MATTITSESGDLLQKQAAEDAAVDSTDEGSSDGVSVMRKLVEIPRERGLANMQRLLEEDMCNRYQAKKPELNFLLNSERAFAKFLGMKYATALNSGGIAISLGLEAMKRVLFENVPFEAIRVYSNAFTFHAVPSAVVVAGFTSTLKLIEATNELVLDLDHLESCIQDDLNTGRFKSGNMILVLSYMRGRVPNMHRVVELCEKYDVKLLEDSAHGYGCSFDGKMCGSFGLVSTISTQANKLVNTGEGGMVFTNNDAMQAYFIFAAGSYEELWRKHEEMSPPEEVCLQYKYTVANKSVRMTNIQAALMEPQLAVMQDRIDHHNAMYNYLVDVTTSKLESLSPGLSQRLHFVPQADPLVGPVYDSLQVRIMDEDGQPASKELNGLTPFLKMLQDRKYSIAKFSDPANARNYVSWQYLNRDDIASEALPKTAQVLLNVCDLRMLCHDSEAEMDKLANDLAECFQASFSQ